MRRTLLSAVFDLVLDSANVRTAVLGYSQSLCREHHSARRQESGRRLYSIVVYVVGRPMWGFAGELAKDVTSLLSWSHAALTVRLVTPQLARRNLRYSILVATWTCVLIWKARERADAELQAVDFAKGKPQRGS